MIEGIPSLFAEYFLGDIDELKIRNNKNKTISKIDAERMYTKAIDKYRKSTLGVFRELTGYDNLMLMLHPTKKSMERYIKWAKIHSVHRSHCKEKEEKEKVEEETKDTELEHELLKIKDNDDYDEKKIVKTKDIIEISKKDNIFASLILLKKAEDEMNLIKINKKKFRKEIIMSKDERDSFVHELNAKLFKPKLAEREKAKILI